MKQPTIFHVKKRTLLLVASFVWLMAGFNVARLGVLSYQNIDMHPLHIVLSLLVFVAFGTMFFKMSQKHSKRIKGYPEKYRPIWHFFDLKSYLIMIFMMSGGIWLRSSKIAPEVFIAVFYTGLGLALALAGVLLGIFFIKYKESVSYTD